MQKRKRTLDPKAWRDTPTGLEDYRTAREGAQRLANAMGFDYGLEANDMFKIFSVRALPRRENRYGDELRCEVVSCENLERCQVGHGVK